MEENSCVLARQGVEVETNTPEELETLLETADDYTYCSAYTNISGKKEDGMWYSVYCYDHGCTFYSCD